MKDKEITGRLENWVYDPLWNVVWGNCYDDVRKRFQDGEWIHTSDIPSTNKQKRSGVIFKEGDVVDTLNSRYLLGKPQKKDLKE